MELLLIYGTQNLKADESQKKQKAKKNDPAEIKDDPS